MARINYSSCFLFLLSTVLPLFLFSCSEKVKAYRFEEMSANVHQLHTHHVVSLSSLMPATVCSTPTQGSKNLSRHLQVVHKHGPCSPLKNGESKFSIVRQILMDDENRVKSIHSKISDKKSLVADSKVALPVNSGASLGSGNFVVNISIGTPEQTFTVAFDTASDLTFIQCLPCNTSQCYPQKDPYFNPSASSTYSNIPCNSSVCTQLQSILGNKQSCNTTTTTCNYQISYGDGSFSEGDFATDTLTLSPCDVFPDFQFGCGHNNQGTFGSTDGLLGLSRDQISLVSQTAQTYGQLFSYCLPPTSSSTGFLAFGETPSSSTLQYTPILTSPNDPLSYYLNMTGISVGGQKLNISESVFTTSGTIIDSGTVITRLAPDAYSALRSAFRQGMSKYRMAPSPTSVFDTCYDLSGYTTVDVPTIVLHFGGGTDLNVDPSGILYQVSSTVYCLAFAGNSAATDLGILGNTQQLTYEVVYDVVGAKLGFGTAAC